jgi:hypothetical protein
MKKNFTFINFFINSGILGHKNIIQKNIYLYPYSFYIKQFNIQEINKNIKKYNKYYNNNFIHKDFGKDLWIVKDNIGYKGINT